MSLSLSPNRFLYRPTECCRSLKLNNGIEIFCPYYQPLEFIRSPQSKELVRRLKRVETQDKLTIDSMIKLSFTHFFHLHRHDTFDAMVQIPSAAKLSPYIYKIFKGNLCKLNKNILCYDSLLLKNKNQDLIIDYPQLKNENASKETYSRVVGQHYALSTCSTKKDVVFEIKDFGASIRRYFTNFFSINPLRCHEFFEPRKVLITDDTLGESKTFVEAITTLQSIWPNAEFVCFALVRDFPSLTKKVSGLF